MLENIIKKLGFDPSNCDERRNVLSEYYKSIFENENSLGINDNKKSIWSKLSLEELEWIQERGYNVI